MSKLIGGAQDALIRHGVRDDDITLAWVPGAFEIPLTAQKMAETGNYVWELLSKAPPPITIMYAQKSARAWQP